MELKDKENKGLKELEKEFLEAQKNKKIALNNLRKCFASVDDNPVNWYNYYHQVIEGRSRFQ